MALHPSKDRVISGPETYDLLNDVEVGNYDQAYSIEKKGLRINFVPEDEEEQYVEEEPEDNPPHKETNGTPSSFSNPLATSSGTYDDLVTITFTHPLPRLRVTFEGLIGIQTPECKIDPIDQSSPR